MKADRVFCPRISHPSLANEELGFVCAKLVAWPALHAHQVWSVAIAAARYLRAINDSPGELLRSNRDF